MEVKPGYKQTEVGVIPEEWDAMRVCEFASVITGGTPRTEIQAYWNGSYPWVTPTDISDQRDMWASERMISEAGLRSIRQLPANSVLVTCIASIGKNAILRSAGACNQQINAVVAQNEQSPEFLYYSFESSKQYLLANAGMTATRIISKAAFEQLKFPIPPPPEQRAIATALSDVDGLLGGLDRLIAKKRDLKQAAMQQLLTGQTRLPGFHGEWELKRLDALADIRSGGTPSTGEPRFWDGDIPWCTPTDITALNGHKYLGETARMITQLGLKASSAEMIPAHSVVMTSRATIGECAINAVPVSTNQGFKNFVPFTTTDVDFLYYLLGTQKQGFISLCGGSTFLEIGKTQLVAYQVRLPSTKDEQTAIAEVLTEMDGELAALEQRREKTRALKQAMMQELLTGRTRLV